MTLELGGDGFSWHVEQEELLARIDVGHFLIRYDPYCPMKYDETDGEHPKKTVGR